jgi:hypothetical protein
MHWVKDCAISEAALDALRRFVDRMEAVGSRVALMLAPLPGAVMARLEADGRYAYWASSAPSSPPASRINSTISSICGASRRIRNFWMACMAAK